MFNIWKRVKNLQIQIILTVKIKIIITLAAAAPFPNNPYIPNTVAFRKLAKYIQFINYDPPEKNLSFINLVIKRKPIYFKIEKRRLFIYIYYLRRNLIINFWKNLANFLLYTFYGLDKNNRPFFAGK